MNLKEVNQIAGVIIDERYNRVDDRGYLCEILTKDDGYYTKFGQVYMVANHKQGVIRGFHKHNYLIDWFFVANGSAKFILVDDRRTKEEEDKNIYRYQKFIIGAHNPSIITIPPGVFHGWESLTDNTILISTASERYNREKPDEERIDWNYFGHDLWVTKWT